ncbi:MAG: AGE family epimerase/isomerase [Acidobacteria bacterium]|nr:AGE family epimerase/isomerase [Acidobacteriota bacterium]MCB9398925.1 AGE family epimerase/isomerase [Acidobacteriota bacterium]
MENFRDPQFLKAHIQKILAFYFPKARQASGFAQGFLDTGQIYDAETRHLVSSTRHVVNLARASQLFGEAWVMDDLNHGLLALRADHYQEDGRYIWTRSGQAVDHTIYTYGLAFVQLAYASAVRASLLSAHVWLEENWQTLETHCYEAEQGLYKDQADPSWNFTNYRGQNANMHLCEAFIESYWATQDVKFLDRACQIAKRVSLELASQNSMTLVWEHYDANWLIDWEFNRHDPRHLFRPWGFQPGHQAEWAKLLLMLAQIRLEEWMVPRAKTLLDWVLNKTWDTTYGGFYYGIAPDGKVCDGDKYYWVQAETVAACALMAQHDPSYWQWYEWIWEYAWTHFVDHEHGAWYRILSRENQRYDNRKSPPCKTDYHTLGACWDVLHALKAH